MPRPPKLRPDVNEIAFRTVRAATGQADKPQPAGEQKNPEAARRGRKGGERGGTVRKARLSKARRRAIAKKAARARWRGAE